MSGGGKGSGEPLPAYALAGDVCSHPAASVIHGIPIVTADLVLKWCRDAHGPDMSRIDADHLAMQFNLALETRELGWSNDAVKRRESDPSFERVRRIAGAIETLAKDVPGWLEEKRAAVPDRDHSATARLLVAVQEHSGMIAALHGAWKPRGKGRPMTEQSIVFGNFARRIESHWKGQAQVSAVDYFVALAMTWLTGSPVSEEQIRKARTSQVRKQARNPK